MSIKKSALRSKGPSMRPLSGWRTSLYVYEKQGQYAGSIEKPMVYLLRGHILALAERIK
jgi:hypothetical protein